MTPDGIISFGTPFFVKEKKKEGQNVRGRRRPAVLFAGMVMGILCLGIAVSTPGRAEAAKKKVSYSVKNGILTFQGNGAVPSEIRVPDKNKITKIVVKKGITSVPAAAFSEFKKAKEVIIAGSVRTIGEDALPASRQLKKVTMPGSFRFVYNTDNDFRTDSMLPDRRIKINTIRFNTNLSLDALAYIKCNHLEVRKKDPKYKSIKGVIYSKDGKSIVRVPADRKFLAVEEGCEEFCTSAVQYGTGFGLADCDFEYELVCRDLRKIQLPASVRSVNTEKYWSNSDESSRVNEIVTSADHVSSELLPPILDQFPRLNRKRFFAQLPDISTKGGMYVNGWDHCLFLYNGKADEVVIPDQVEKIGEYAFEKSRVKRVVIPDSVKEMEAGVFMDCRSLQEIRLPETMEKMGRSVFYGCSGLKSVRFPNGLSEVPDYTFKRCSSLEEVILPECVTTIGIDAFKGTKIQPSLFQGKKIRK